MSNKQQPMYCPICDVPSDECIDSDEHCGHWITLAERARDEALSNLDTKHLEQSNCTAQPPAS